MNIHEYQAAEILHRYGVPVNPGKVATTPQEAEAISAEFGTLVAVKAQVHSGRGRQIYFFRDVQGLEVDFVVPRRGGRLALIEAKATRSPRPADAAPILRLREAMPQGDVEGFVVHRRGPGDLASAALHPQVKAATVEEVARIVLS